MTSAISFTSPFSYSDLTRYRSTVIDDVAARAAVIEDSVAYNVFRASIDEEDARAFLRSFQTGVEIDVVAMTESRIVLSAVREELTNLIATIGSLRLGQSEILSFQAQSQAIAGGAGTLERVRDSFLDPIRDEVVARLRALPTLSLTETTNAGKITTENDLNADVRAELKEIRDLVEAGLALATEAPISGLQALADALALDSEGDFVSPQTLRFSIEPKLLEVNPLNLPVDRMFGSTNIPTVLGVFSDLTAATTSDSRGSQLDFDA